MVRHTSGMAHLPVNHPAQPLFRVLAGMVALFVLIFGIAGAIETWGLPLFDRGDHWVLGLRTNPAFSLLSIVVGAVVLGGAIYGHNVDHFINLWGGAAFLVAGIVMLTVLRTELNVLNFAVRNCIVSFLIGLAMMLAGLYGKIGPPDYQREQDEFRHGSDGWDAWRDRARPVQPPPRPVVRSGLGMRGPGRAT